MQKKSLADSKLKEANEHYYQANNLYEEIIRDAVKEHGHRPLAKLTGRACPNEANDVLNKGSIDRKKKFAELIKKSTKLV